MRYALRAALKAANHLLKKFVPCRLVKEGES